MRQFLHMPDACHLDEAHVSGFDGIQLTVIDDDLPAGITVETQPIVRKNEDGTFTWDWNYPVDIRPKAEPKTAEDGGL